MEWIATILHESLQEVQRKHGDVRIAVIDEVDHSHSRIPWCVSLLLRNVFDQLKIQRIIWLGEGGVAGAFYVNLDRIGLSPRIT